MRTLLLLAAICGFASAAPQSLKSQVVATGAAVPVAVRGFKAVAGDNGDLKVACNIRMKTSGLTSTFI